MTWEQAFKYALGTIAEYAFMEDEGLTQSGMDFKRGYKGAFDSLIAIMNEVEEHD